jgi:putative cardiolipin synthase
MMRRLIPLVLLLLSGCAQLPPRPPVPVQTALPPGSETRLDEVIGSSETRHPGQSAFRLVSTGPEAFAVRANTARLAGRSLDVQTYIWHADLTGRYLAKVLLDAADRGVRVRLLLDDMDARSNNYGFAAMDAHPNIEVRLFNPLPSRSGTLAMLGDMLGSGQRLNHRMHNKTWIADNRFAVVGGRNLGDEYFGASDEVNFVDLDFAMTGPVVQDASASFDRYWNSIGVYPIALLSPEGVTEDALKALRERLANAADEAKHSEYAELLARDDAVRRLVGGDWPMTWVSEYRFISDDPLKALESPGADRSQVLTTLVPEVGAARRDLTIISPYFVPGQSGTSGLVQRAGEIDSVRVLTNSLAANDVAAVHGGYSRYRKALLKGGVQLWELKPAGGAAVSASMFGSSGASLHTKALSIDGSKLFVGSYNLDPRSTSLNCEQGILVDSRDLAAQFNGLFDKQTSGARAWRLSLDHGEIRWSDDKQTLESEPSASFGRKFQAWLGRVLPVESQL